MIHGFTRNLFIEQPPNAVPLGRGSSTGVAGGHYTCLRHYGIGGLGTGGTPQTSGAQGGRGGVGMRLELPWVDAVSVVQIAIAEAEGIGGRNPKMPIW